MAQAGISTLGILFGYASESTAGDKPSAFKPLTRINSIGGITLDVEQIDASALEDMVSRYISGRQDTGGSFSVTVNLTDETATEWETLIAEYKALTGGKKMWFETWSPYFTKAFYVVAQPPIEIPQPQCDQNGLWTVEMSLVIEEYKGIDTAIKPVAP